MKNEGENIGLPKEEKLTDWAKEPSVMSLKEDFEAAKPAHDAHIAKIRHWNELRLVTGSARPKKVKGRSSVQPKTIRRQAEWRYSALSEPFLSSEKLFTVEPHTWEDQEGAEQNEILLNWQFRTKLNRVRFIDEYVRTATDEGGVIVRLGWKRETKMVKVMEPIYEYVEVQSEEEMAVLQQAMELKETNPRGFLDLPPEARAAVEFSLQNQIMVMAYPIGEEEVEQEKILVNQPTAEVMNPENVTFDPSCNGIIEDARFAVVSFETSKADLIRDGRYKNLASVNWSGNTALAQPDHDSQTPNDFNFKDDLRKRVVAHEYWGWYDVHGNDELIPIVATWIGDTMIRLEENPFPDESLPFVVVPYMPVKRQVMGEPDAELLEDNQAILGAVTRGMIDLLGRSANAQTGYSKSFLDPVNRRRFEQGQDYEFNPGVGDPRQALYQHTYPEIPNSALTMLQLQNSEAEAISGIKSFSGGLSSEAYGDVATGIRGMLDAAGKREMNILRRLAKGIQDIGTKIASMNAAFLSEEEVIRVTNEKYVTVRREDLKSNFDLVVDISTQEVDQLKAQDLGFMLQTIGPNMDETIRNMILAEIARLKRMPKLAHAIKNYEPQPDPFVEQMKQLELEKITAEIDKLKSEAERNRAQANKAETEADINNLDFIEQESGTKHARDLQKQSEQARANQDLEVTKGLLKTRKPEEKAPDVEAAVGYNAITERSGRAGIQSF